MDASLDLQIVPQPDDSTCGPTCLHAIYQYFGDTVALHEVLREVQSLSSGGTLAVLLACHALRRGYAASLYTYNLQLFDLTWFPAEAKQLARKLEAQARSKRDVRTQTATDAYLEFLALGGRVLHEELRPELIRRLLERRIPILAGLSATYLYGCAREIGTTRLEFDDVNGEPVGHFVVVCGYHSERRTVRVADPQPDTPRFGSHDYEVGIDRLLGAILLGALTYDANLLVLEPPATRERSR